MQRRRSVVFGSLGSLVLTVLIAAGCTPVPNPGEPSASATPSSTPSAAPAVEVADCDTVLTQEGYDDLASGNLIPFEYTFVLDWDYILLEEMVATGVVCKWAGNQSDVDVVLGQLAMDEREWESTRTELEATGFVLDESHGIPGFLNGHDSTAGSQPNRGFAWRDGILYYVNYPEFLEFVPAFQS